MSTQRRKLRSVPALAAVLVMTSATASVHAVNPQDFRWTPKETLPPGASAAVLYGDLSRGPYDFIARFPAAYRVPSHWHTHAVQVVLRYAASCPQGCTFLAHGVQPFDIHYVRAADDPRLASVKSE